MKTMTVAYHPGDHAIVYALAACLKLGIELHPAAAMRELWDIDSHQILLLDIKPDDIYFADLETYLQMQSHKIIGQYALSELYHNEQTLAPELALIRKSLMTINGASTDIEMMERQAEENLLIRRHLEALKAAAVKAKNTDDPTFYRRTLHSVAREIAGTKAESDIDVLASFFSRVEYMTQSAFSRISYNHDIFRIPNRKVAYAYLSNISPWLDLERLKKMALAEFGYLVILQYRSKDNELTWIGSDGRLDIRQFFDLSRNGSGNEILLPGSHRLISRFLREKISELTE